MTELLGETLCECWACGKSIAVLFDANGEADALAHEPNTITGVLGPNGETGCDVFDELEDSFEAGADFLRKCREALEQQQKRN